MNPLVMCGVRKHFARFDLAVDLVIPSGLVTGLVGPNGAGKTTILKCALGAVQPDAGEVTLIDKARVGTIFDTPHYNPIWTVGDVAAIAAGFYAVWDAAGFAAALQRAGISLRTPTRELSRGQGMQLQLAVALAHDADFLILDEPSAGLDPLAREEFIDTIRDFMTDERHSVLFSSQVSSDLEKIADRIVLVADGRILAATPLPQLLETYRLVAGGEAQRAAVASKAIALRQHEHGWDALVPTDAVDGLGQVAISAPTLDDIVARITKENRDD